ncbi:hypothetical protein [Mycobacterium sp. MAC_080597_8934]|uniref:hypothetical protein n=1 Tax=Mycobacterium sp. MAC_080597_8934 TaxID=1335322 RepID=UPI0012DC82C8|nr:hypothetical protein [Mycobacterium sp. MAC_080597_8934]
MAATALAIGGLGLAGLGIATQAQAHPGPFPQWCPGEFWDPGWGNNWDWNNCHDWRGGPPRRLRVRRPATPGWATLVRADRRRRTAGTPDAAHVHVTRTRPADPGGARSRRS